MSGSGVDENKHVIIATSLASLLSGALDECYSADDETCNGGVAAARALQRYYQEDEPALFMQRLDKDNAFVHMHPLGLSVNRLVLNSVMGLPVFFSTPAILLQNKIDYEVSNNDISWLQNHRMPLLLTNVGVPPTNSWFAYTRAVYFDQDTHLAVMSVSKSNERLNVNAIESTVSTLRYISKINEENGCGDAVAGDGVISKYLDSEDFLPISLGEQSTLGLKQNMCWIPVVYFDGAPDKFVSFLDGMLDLPAKQRPALVIDTEGNFEKYETPTLVGEDQGEINGIWVASHGFDGETYHQHKLTVSVVSNEIRIVDIEYMTAPLSPLPDEAKDEVYGKEIVILRKIADEAMENNPIIGYSTYMPFTRDSSSYRRCKAGECPIGNLFTDAARWYANADVAFVTSGGLRGPGWEAGPVRVSDAWDALPFPNNICTGVMNGIHLFQLFNYSISMSTFEGENTENGGRLLQVSGMKVTYNTQLKWSRLVSIEVWNKNSSIYEPLERLKLYKFATDSFLCGAYTPYPAYLGNNLTMEGEQPGTVGNALHQEVVAVFLNSTTNRDNLYNASVQSRLVNDTSVSVAMNFIQTEAKCDPGTFWKPDLQSCMTCPTNVDVFFSKQFIQFELDSGSNDPVIEDTSLKNHGNIPVAVIPKSAPSWLAIKKEVPILTEGLDFQISAPASLVADLYSPTILGPGDVLELSMIVDPTQLEPGTSLVTVGFGVTDGGEYPGCSIKDSTFDVTMRVLPPQQLNQLGNIRVVGYTLASIVAFTSIFLGVFTYWYRKSKIVRAMQPFFLIVIITGTLIMGSSMIPLSMDDEIASQQGCNIACMATPWLLSMGFTFAMSALFSKLWRINRLFHTSRFIKVRVRAQDVSLPLVVLFILNFIILLTWTLVDPLTWQRFVLNGESWNTYGTCTGSSRKSHNTFLALCAVLNTSALLIALWQAWKARDISDDYSEAKSVGVALYSWLQLFIVGFPVLFLIDRDNPTARYFILVALIFAVCMSMLLIIFTPIYLQMRKLASDLNSETSEQPENKVECTQQTVNESWVENGLTSDGSHANPSFQYDYTGGESRYISDQQYSVASTQNDLTEDLQLPAIVEECRD